MTSSSKEKSRVGSSITTFYNLKGVIKSAASNTENNDSRQF